MAVTDPIQQRVREVRQRIIEACVVAGRDPAEVSLLPVTKTAPGLAIRALTNMGIRRVGESKPQEIVAKTKELRDLAVEWVVVGHLQTNKVKTVVPIISELQSLDSLKLATELDRRLQAEGRALDVLVQVNSSGEPQKHGVAPSEVRTFTRELRHFHSLQVRGLMTLAVHSDDPARVDQCFETVRQLQRDLQHIDGGGWDELSMGMSGDFERAIAHGATCVRIGQAIFGPRPA